MTSSQETEQVCSYNPGAHTGPHAQNFIAFEEIVRPEGGNYGLYRNEAECSQNKIMGL